VEVRQTVLAEISIRSAHWFAGTDIGALIRRLIMFDKVIVKHGSLEELPTLVETFGSNGLQELLDLGVLKFADQSTTVSVSTRAMRVPSAPLDQFELVRLVPCSRPCKYAGCVRLNCGA
jgi:hypothetical protein